MPTLRFQHRRLTDELMDAPDLAASEHHQALAGLRRINWISGTAGTMARPILALARRERLTSIRLLDVACGGGEVPVAVARRLMHRGIQVHLTLLDKSPTALTRAAALAQGIPHTTHCGDALSLPSGETFEVVTNSLFLHHLPTESVVTALAQMRARTGRLLVVSDLRRGLSGYLLAHLACRVLSRSSIVHFDGPVSVAAAFSLSEFVQLAKAARLSEARIARSWPGRILLVWPRLAGDNS